MVIAHVDFVGQLKIDRSDAVIGGFLSALEYFVALGIFNFENKVLGAGRLKVERLQRQRANVNELTGLIERLIRHQQDFGIGFDAHVLFELIGTQRGLRAHEQLIRPGRKSRDLKSRLGNAASVGLCLLERDELAILGFELDFDLGAGQGNRFRDGLDRMDIAPERGRAAREKLASRGKRRFMSLDGQDLSQPHFRFVLTESAAHVDHLGRQGNPAKLKAVLSCRFCLADVLLERRQNFSEDISRLRAGRPDQLQVHGSL